MGKITRRTAISASAALAFAGAAQAQPAAAAATTWSARAPNRKTEMALRRTAEGALQYRVLLYPRRGRARVVVDWSDLGLVVALHNTFEQREPALIDFTRGVEFVSAANSRGEDVYTLVTGKQRVNRARYTQVSATFNIGESQLRIDARAYNDGVAFRYALPQSSVMHHWVREERTSFNMGTNGRHWGQPYDFFTRYHPSYETLYDNPPLGTPTPADQGTSWGFPSLFELEGAWVLLHETGLDAHYHGSHLQKDAPGGVYKLMPPGPEEALGFGANFPTSPLPWEMPWRMFIVSDDIADIAESNLVFHLAQPSRVADTSWIKPGAAAWNWAYDHGSGLIQAKLREFIDLAATMNWPYALMDANWNKSDSARPMEDLVAYANSKNVGLLFWYNSGGRHNMVTEEPRNIMDDRARRRAEFARLQALGVKGVKVDFWQSDKQDIIKLYLDLLEDAADFRLLANFHGCTIPRGWQRTWPNLVSMEAVRGAEFYTFDSQPNYGEVAPRQNVIHPFLRNVIGSMDYTPVMFSTVTVRPQTSKAHEAALAVLFESGVQHYCDGPTVYPALPAEWRRYLSEAPTVWDETKLLTGRPGEHVVMARRAGTRWYVAGANGEARQKTVSFSLAGLEGIGREALVLFDGGANGFGSRRQSVGANVRETLSANGGFVMIFDA